MMRYTLDFQLNRLICSVDNQLRVLSVDDQRITH